MIAYIKGKVTDIEADKIIVESGNIGYNIFVPGAYINKIGGVGAEVKVYTYLNVREDAMTLYGFSSKDELYIFKLLLGVSGIGPKGAIGILSAISPDDLRVAVMSGDSKTISKAPGIGNKTAMKLIIELKDKLKIEDMFVSANDSTQDNTGSFSNIKNEAMQALVALGYSQSESARAVKNVKTDDGSTVEDVIKSALRNL